MGGSRSAAGSLGHMTSDNRQLVIVAIPSEDDPVWKVSSEKVPHLTLLYLGVPQFDSSQIDIVTGYVEHAASMLPPFMLDVEGRGELGDKNADVLFFEKKRPYCLSKFRAQLLRNDLVSKAYLSADQFPEWNPHLTMGYPDSPAKKDTRERPGFYHVNFDKIALWTGDYEGPTFRLNHPVFDMEVAMSQIERGRSAMDGVIKHYGVKGMKWGVRRSQAELDSASGRAPSADAAEASRAINKAATTGGLHTLSNQELQKAITRMNLENQYRNLTSTAHQTELDRGLQNVQKALKVGKTVEDVRKFMKTPTGQAIKTGLVTAASAAAAYATGGASAAAAAGTSVVVRRAANHYTNVGR